MACVSLRFKSFNLFLFIYSRVLRRFEQSISEGSAGPSAAPTVQPHPHWIPSSAVHAAKPQKPTKPPSQTSLLKKAIAAHMEKNSVQTMASEAMMRVKQDLKFRRKTVAPDKAKLRCAGGQVWYDPSLEDWDPSKCIMLWSCIDVCTHSEWVTLVIGNNIDTGQVNGF